VINKDLFIGSIPAILWGDTQPKLLIAVHGNMSSKADIPIAVLAEEATKRGYQVLSFDLPEHGARKEEATVCNAQNCVSDLKEVMSYAKANANEISLMANSMGAYFSLLAYPDETIKQSLFLSPVLDMERIIQNMMRWFNVTEERLFQEKEIPTPIGQVLYWDYYQYVKSNPVKKWDVPTSILYGKKDALCEWDVVTTFAQKFGCKLEISEASEHYFHTEKDMEIYRRWLGKKLLP
jgi:alpha-beta hydrolase superfamily lysophospholipase